MDLSIDYFVSESIFPYTSFPNLCNFFPPKKILIKVRKRRSPIKKLSDAIPCYCTAKNHQNASWFKHSHSISNTFTVYLQLPTSYKNSPIHRRLLLLFAANSSHSNNFISTLAIRQLSLVDLPIHLRQATAMIPRENRRRTEANPRVEPEVVPARLKVVIVVGAHRRPALHIGIERKAAFAQASNVGIIRAAIVLLLQVPALLRSLANDPDLLLRHVVLLAKRLQLFGLPFCW